ncbi:MAG: hypothetical protein Q9188_002998 [Gyalolechia gomerana]
MPDLEKMLRSTRQFPAPDDRNVQNVIRKLNSIPDEAKLASKLAFHFLPTDELMDSRPLFHERNKTFDDWPPLDAPPKVPNLITPQPDLTVGYKATDFDVGALQRLDALPRGKMLVFPIFFTKFKGKSHRDVARSENLLTGAMASRNLHAFFGQAGQADLSNSHARTFSTDSNGNL